MREGKRKKEEEEKEAQKRAEEEEEEERRRREEQEARMRAEEEEAKKRMMEEEETRKKAEEEEARRRAEEQEAARLAQEAVIEPQTREDPDIELVTEETLDHNLSVQEAGDKTKAEVHTTSHTEKEPAKDEELEDGEGDLEINGTLAEAGPQLNKKEDDEDLENQTLGESDADPAVPSDGVNTHRPSSPAEGADIKDPSNISRSSNVEQNKVRNTASNKGHLSRNQEKREQRRRRGLEHNQRATERASSSATGKDDVSPPKSKSQVTSKPKEHVDSKETDQVTLVALKMKEHRGKKDVKGSPPSASPVRPSTLSLQPAEPAHERNGVGERPGAVNLRRHLEPIKEEPEKWRGRRNDGEVPEGATPPQTNNRDEKRKTASVYVFSSGFSQTSHFLTAIFLLRQDFSDVVSMWFGKIGPC